MSALPPLLAGASLLFWGWQTGNWLPAVVLAVLLEAPRRMSLRFDLGVTEHSRIADLCTILFVALAALLAVNRGVAQGILGAFQWLPVALAPILLAQFLSESGRVPLSALFRYLRKMKRADPSVKDPPVDTGPVYVAIVLVSAGVANARGPGFYAGVVLAAAWGLYAARPRYAGSAAFALMLGAGAAAGYAGHAGLVQLRDHVEAWVADWFLRGLGGDPYRAATDIGTIGKLKLLDTIVLRVYARPAEADRVRLLHRASYNTYIGTTWLARNAPMESVTAEAGGLSWALVPAQPDWTARIAARIERGRLVLAAPSSTARITGLAASTFKRNALGTLYAEVAGDWIQYEAETAAAADTSAPPGREDLVLPARERATFEALAAELGLRDVQPEAALHRVREFFSGFSYSLWRERPAPEGATPLGDFVGNARSGHCEYFAAATALLLRAGGIPAHYATGFAVMEYSTLEDAFVVRARHAHAWTRAWDGSRWVDVDTTPPSWVEEEEKSLAPFWQKLADLARWAGFRWSQRGELQASDGWYAVLALLVAVLGWRLLRGRRVARGAGAASAEARAWPGMDSELYEVARSLPDRGAAETLQAWFDRVSPSLPAESRARLEEALGLHQRYRFDPQGLEASERARLRELCGVLLPRS